MAIWSIVRRAFIGNRRREMDATLPQQEGSLAAHDANLVLHQEISSGAPRVANSIGVQFVLVPAGEFMMGSPDSEWRGEIQKSERPQHRVRITEPFYLGACQVTQEQYQRIMGKNPSYFKGDLQRPVERVSWDDAAKFCRKLSKKEGVTYRLPTEAEWEYACRGGTTTRFHFGDDPKDLGDYAWWGGNADAKTHPVATKKPNAWGLYDMHGNVFEWCADWYAEDDYARSLILDPRGPGTGLLRVLRGGSYRGGFPLSSFRCASRYFQAPGRRFNDVGFRIACTLLPPRSLH